MRNVKVNLLINVILKTKHNYLHCASRAFKLFEKYISLYTKSTVAKKQTLWVSSTQIAENYIYTKAYYLDRFMTSSV